MEEKMFKGPCKLCGDKDYPLSTDGPEVCPACACYPPQRRIFQLREEIESLEETCDIMADTNTMKSLRKSVEQIKKLRKSISNTK